MKRLILVLTIVCITLVTFAQEKNDTTKVWKTNGNFSINFNEATFSNWLAGGTNSLSGVALFDLNFDYKKDKNSWENFFHLGYGLQKEDGNDVIKSEDKIEFNSKYGRQTNNEKIFISGLFNFRTQMANGYEYPDTETRISGLFAPAYFSLALGLDYKPSDKLSLFLSPISGKFTVVSDDDIVGDGAFGLEKSENFRSEMGAFFKAEAKAKLVKNVDLTTKIDLFSNYLEEPQNIDINWDLTINMKINSFLSANFISSLLYDHDVLIPLEGDKVGRRIQFKHLFGVGLNYKF